MTTPVELSLAPTLTASVSGLTAAKAARQVSIVLDRTPTRSDAPSAFGVPAASTGAASRLQVIQRLQRRKQELLDFLEPSKEAIRRNIFATIRAGVVSQLLAFLKTNLYSVNERDYSGSTPLHIAAHDGRQDMLSVLISFGADLDAVDNYGRTARDVAAANRHSNICRYLLQAATKKLLHADPNAPAFSREGSSDPLGGNVEVVSPTDMLSPRTPVNTAADSFPGSPVLAPAAEPEEGRDDLQVSHFCTIPDNISVVVCMVGLPGRGKSFISKRLSRYLNWKGIRCKVFNAGNYRRALLGADATAGADFYDPNNANAKELREKMAHLACEDLVKFIQSVPVGVGVLDATNTTMERRRHLVTYFKEKEALLKKPVRIIFIESVCTDENIITENILRAKCGNDDFKNVADANTVIAEFRERIRQYEKVYEALDAGEGVSFLKIMNVKEHIVIHKIAGAIGTRIAYFLINLHPVAPPLFIALHGETIGNSQGQFGGDERLTAAGEQYAKRLAAFVLERCGQQNAMEVIYGTNRSVTQTLEPLAMLEKRGYVRYHASRCLDDINFGRMTGETLQESFRNHPKMSQLLFGLKKFPSNSALSDSSSHQMQLMRRMNYQVCFPCGESRRQVNLRIEPVLLQIQRSKNPMLIVSSHIPAAGIATYFTDKVPESSSTTDMPFHAVLEVGSKGEVTVHDLSCDSQRTPLH
jgi:broad specificity phosphatase PhoE